jgi:hypothetical protein
MSHAFAFTILVMLAAAAGCKKAPARVDAGPMIMDGYASYLTRFPFGGRTLEWWQERLVELSPAGTHPDAALYALTVERAEKNGLVVEGKGSALTVRPDPKLTEIIMKRTESK